MDAARPADGAQAARPSSSARPRRRAGSAPSRWVPGGRSRRSAMAMRRLAAPGLPRDAERLARADVQVDAPHGGHAAAGVAVGHVQVADRQDGIGGTHRSTEGSSAHRPVGRRGSRMRSSARPNEGEGQHHGDDAQPRRPVVPPGVERDGAAGQRALQHLAPRGLERVAEAEEGQRRLGQDRSGTVRMALARMSGPVCGSTWRVTRCQPPAPSARSARRRGVPSPRAPGPAGAGCCRPSSSPR